MTQRRVAFTFDDLPVTSGHLRADAELESIVMRQLAKIETAKIPVAGFVNEGQLFVSKEWSDVARRYSWLEQWAHTLDILGNHTYSHLDLHNVSVAEFQDDIIRGELFTRRTLGDAAWQRQKFFRYPHLHAGESLAKRQAVAEFLRARNYRVAPVTVDANDWLFSAAYDIADLDGNIEMLNAIGSAYQEYTRAILALSEQCALQIFGRLIPQIFMLHSSALNARHLNQIISIFSEANYRFVGLADALTDSVFAENDTEHPTEGDWQWFRARAAIRGKTLDISTPATPTFVQEITGFF